MDEVKLLQKALGEVIKDPLFSTKSPSAVKAKEDAMQLLKWCEKPENHLAMTAFETEIVEGFKNIFVSPSGKPVKRDMLWRSYILIRSSTKFVGKWQVFLESAQCSATPILYQHLTDLIFKDLVYENFQICIFKSRCTYETEAITIPEANALRYAAGYVCRHLRQKLKRGTDPLKEEMILCLMELVKDCSDETVGTSEEWTILVDRGGLWYVKETTYALFLPLEQETQPCLQSIVSEPNAAHKNQFIDKICSSDDVQFQWLTSSADFEIEDSQVNEGLLKKLVELFLTIRGFAFTSVWNEKYKQHNKKSTQRSKGLRKELYSNSDNS